MSTETLSGIVSLLAQELYFVVCRALVFNSVLEISLVCLTLLSSFSPFHMLIALHSKVNFTFRAVTYAHLR